MTDHNLNLTAVVEAIKRAALDLPDEPAPYLDLDRALGDLGVLLYSARTQIDAEWRGRRERRALSRPIPKPISLEDLL